uniref:Uncharacterized protein n=1 Tax=Anguilla anguilla TaxID=7936 RepID=A0A0E9VSX4_ANGAN
MTTSDCQTSTGRCQAPTTTFSEQVVSHSLNTTAPKLPGKTWHGKTRSSLR